MRAGTLHDEHLLGARLVTLHHSLWTCCRSEAWLLSTTVFGRAAVLRLDYSPPQSLDVLPF